MKEQSFISPKNDTFALELKVLNLHGKFESFESSRLHNRLVILSKYASLKKNEKKRERVAVLASKLYVMACQEYKNAHTAKVYELPEIKSVDMAAEPFECYNWNRLDQDIIDLFGGDKTILVGCFKNKKHLSWINENGIYKIRLGNRAGSIDEDKECINNAQS